MTPHKQKQTQKKLSNGFDPIWKEDFIEFSFLSTTAFFLRLFMISFRDPTTDIFNKSDIFIQKVTKISRPTIIKAKKELLKHGIIIKEGYHTYLIRQFRRFPPHHTFSKPVKKLYNQLSRNFTTTCKETLQPVVNKPYNQLSKNFTTAVKKFDNPIYTETYNTDNTEGKDLKGYVSKEEIPTLRKLYPFKDRHKLQTHLEARGLNGQEIGKAFELIYPQQYTGRRAF